VKPYRNGDRHKASRKTAAIADRKNPRPDRPRINRAAATPLSLLIHGGRRTSSEGVMGGNSEKIKRVTAMSVVTATIKRANAMRGATGMIKLVIATTATARIKPATATNGVIAMTKRESAPETINAAPAEAIETGSKTRILGEHKTRRRTADGTATAIVHSRPARATSEIDRPVRSR
jgi:hypothetical protein